MKTRDIKIEDLKPAEYNPRTISKKQRENLKRSILKYGIIDPIIVNKNKKRKGIVIGGHQRLKILKELGYKKVPCIELDLNLEEEKELNIRLNKNTGEFDIELLNEHFTIEELSDYGFEKYEIGGEEAELSILDETEDDEEVELAKRNVLQIEFDQEYYEEAKTLHKTLKDAGVDVGKLFIEKMKKEK